MTTEFMCSSFRGVTCDSPAVGSVGFFHYSQHVVPHRWILQNPASVGLIPVPSAEVPSLDPALTHVHAHVSRPVLRTCLWADFLFLFPGTETGGM